MKLVLKQVKPEEVVENESYLLLRHQSPTREVVGYNEWIEAVASKDGWAFNDAPNEVDPERSWPTMIFQCPRNGSVVED